MEHQQQFLEYLQRERGLSPLTISAYERDLDRLSAELERLRISDLEQVEKISLEVAREVLSTVPGAIRDHEPRIRYNEFGSSPLNFRVVLAVEEFYDSYELTHQYVKRLKKRYNQEGITIPFNMVTLDIPDRPEISVRLNGSKNDVSE